jgi:ElaB/YqjD/DUF883 family membrane-anchored ribosome-binding protein
MTNDQSGNSDRPSSSATEQLRSQAGTVREDLSQLGKLAKDATKEKIGEAREIAAGYYEKGRVKAGELETELIDYVRAKPLKSVLIAAGIGALLGILVSRR